MAALLRQVEVVAGGVQTTVQDHPGRVGLWEVGVPPSGPMDPRSLQHANRLVGNAPGTAALEATYAGPELRFPGGALVAVSGAPVPVQVDGLPVPMHEPVVVPPGGLLAVGAILGPGIRSYVAIRGGLDVPEVLGSRATFVVGRLGGHEGRPLAAGDRIPLGPFPAAGAPAGDALDALRAAAPPIGAAWELAVLHGPHGAPDVVAPHGLDGLLGAEWTVHRHADRAGIRLVGDGRTAWARPDGGEAGLDPSNVIDCAYAIGAVMVTGDTPIVVAVDGPSLGGFAAPFCVAERDLWKIGQLRPGDRVRFALADDGVAVDAGEGGGAPPDRVPEATGAGRGDGATASRATHAGRGGRGRGAAAERQPAILGGGPAGPGVPSVVLRRAGDRDVLVEYGDPVVDLALRLRVHALQAALRDRGTPGVLDLTPGVRSLQVRYDPARLPTARLVDLLAELEDGLGDTSRLRVPCRTVTMPFAFDDRWTAEAVRRYQADVRPDAPWCPDNVEFVRRINGLASRDDVGRIMHEAAYVVLGLGDVYLGAPVALPLDPRHQLVTTKYTPPRTWTAEGGVGLGGAFLCVYGMESPGGYQLVGRTVPIWDRRSGRARPWLLQHFDHVRFEPVTDEQLERLHVRARDGHRVVSVEEHEFHLEQRRRLEQDHAPEIRDHQRRRTAAFDQERTAWAA